MCVVVPVHIFCFRFNEDKRRLGIWNGEWGKACWRVFIESDETEAFVSGTMNGV